MYTYTYTYTHAHTQLTVGLDGRGDVLAQALVDVKHVQVDASQLHDKGVAHGLAGTHVSLQDAAQLSHCLWVLQDVHVLKSHQGLEKVEVKCRRQRNTFTSQ